LTFAKIDSKAVTRSLSAFIWLSFGSYRPCLPGFPVMEDLLPKAALSHIELQCFI
jgi:hypothetical protein